MPESNQMFGKSNADPPDSFLTVSNEVEKPLCIRFVCPSVYVRSNFFIYSSKVLKFKNVVHIWYKMDQIENGTYGAKVFLCRVTRTFSDTLQRMEGTFLKRVF